MYNEEQVKETLKQLTIILETEKVEYRLLGSVVTAAINGSLYRRVGDIDLILDEKKKDKVFAQLTKLGYGRVESIMFVFARKYLALETLDHPELQSIGYFWGRWKKDGSFVMENRAIKVRIEHRGIEPSKYSLLGIDFVGIPPGAIATGIMTSRQNVKRKKEIKLMQEKNIEPLVNNYIHIHIFGIPFDLAYHGTMALLNLLGVIRQKLGLPFDPWRSKIQ